MSNNIDSKIIFEGMKIGDFILLLISEIISSIDKNKMIEEKELLSIQDCSLKRGISVQTIGNWMKSHDIKRYRMGRRVFLDSPFNVPDDTFTPVFFAFLLLRLVYGNRKLHINYHAILVSLILMLNIQHFQFMMCQGIKLLIF